MLKHTKHLRALLEESRNNGKYVSISRISPGQEIVAIIRPLANGGFSDHKNLNSVHPSMIKMLEGTDNRNES